MRIVLGIVGLALILIVLGDAFETIILPRRVKRRLRLTRVFYRVTWVPWRWVAHRLYCSNKRRDAILGFYGPLSLILLLVIWTLGLITGFGFLHYAFGSGLEAPLAGHPIGLGLDLYYSGTTFTTLGLGEIHPSTNIARFLSIWEAGTGFGLLAIVIGYLPIIYQAFSARERAIALLDSRAGSPPTAVEMLRRYAENRDLQEINLLLRDWEQWAAFLLESHISYPVLMLYRSQHSNESWLGSLTTILDACALIITGIDGIPTRQAELTFAIARHALVDLSQVLATPPEAPIPERLTCNDVAKLRVTLKEHGTFVADNPAADKKLHELRAYYEPYVSALARYLVLPIPPWFPLENSRDNWQTSAWEHAASRIRPSSLDVLDEHL